MVSMYKVISCTFVVVLAVGAFLSSCEALQVNPDVHSVTGTYVIGASKDDAWSKFDDVQWDDASYYLSRSDMRGGCRWSIDIPKGALIEQANFTCRAKSSSMPGAKCRIQVFDQDSCDDFDVIFWEWTVMSGAVDWNLPTFTADMWFTSPDLREIVQAFVDRPGYVSENYLGLKFVWQGGTEREHEAWAWDGSVSSAAKLEVTYTTGIPPIANFTYSPEAPIVDETITFDASSSYDPDGTVVSYSWSFGDGGSSVTEGDPFTTHVYASWGEYIVTLDVTDSEGKQDTGSKLITVVAKPHADFAWTPTFPQEGVIVTFNASLSTPDGGNIVSYTWDFENDSIVDSYGMIVNHAYNSIGTYIVTLNVTDSDGMWDIESRSITIVKPPVSSFTYSPSIPITNESITFNASTSTPNGGAIVSYLWDFDDGSPVINETSPITTHNYTTTEIYNVTLTIIDSNGLSDSTSKLVKVRIAGIPVADFVYSPTAPTAGETIIFDASSSFDSDGFVANYRWEFGDDTTGTGVITAHIYVTTGTYNITLAVMDNENLTDFTSKFIVVRGYPVASFTSSPSTPLIDEIVTFDASSSTPNGGTIVDYVWNFGDGNTTAATVPIITHTYTVVGTYNVTVTLTDSEGLSDIESKLITVGKIPIAAFTYLPAVPISNQTVTFNASLSTTEGGTIISYFWDFGDGNTAIVNAPIIRYIYASTGNYTVVLNITNSEGLWGIRSETLRIYSLPVALFVFTPDHPAPNDIVLFNATGSYDPDGTIVNYNWDFGDGNLTTTSNSTITHIYSEAGDHNVILIVIDNHGYSNSTLHVITVHLHDIAILNVIVSHTDVYIGQVVHITITAKNEGTTTESFNVSVFCNETLIETQLVSSLAPDKEETLSFYWDTSGIADTANFLIQVKAEVVSGESDEADNTCAGDFVKVSEDHSPLILDWNWILIVVLFVLFSAAGILWKMRRSSQKLHDFEFFEEITGGGIPNSFSVLITGEPGSGKSLLCQQITCTSLAKGKPCIYITYDCFPDEIRESMERFHWNLSKYENEGKFVFVDCFSSIAQVTDTEKYSVSQPFSLSDLGIMMSKATSEVTDAPRVFLDSIIPLLTHVDSSRVVEFLQDRSARIKGVNGTFIFTVGKETMGPNLTSRLEEAADCVIELEASTSEGKTVRRLRIKKMRGRRVYNKWIPFSINPSNGIVFPV